MDDDIEIDGVEQAKRLAYRPNGDAATAVLDRRLVFDFEFDGDDSIVTIFDGGAPRLKQKMSYADIERLLDCLPSSPVLCHLK